MSKSSSLLISINGLNSQTLSFDADDFIRRILSLKDITSGQFDFTFVSPEKIRTINQSYLKRDYVTDIISFNLGDVSAIVGDVYICLEKAQENATAYETSLDSEIKLLIVHGILHLLDYGDYTDKEKKIMEQEQQRLLLEAER